MKYKNIKKRIKILTIIFKVIRIIFLFPYIVSNYIYNFIYTTVWLKKLFVNTDKKRIKNTNYFYKVFSFLRIITPPIKKVLNMKKNEDLFSLVAYSLHTIVLVFIVILISIILIETNIYYVTDDVLLAILISLNLSFFTHLKRLSLDTNKEPN